MLENGVEFGQFVIGEFSRPLVDIQLDFTIVWGDKTPMEPDAFRYESSTGLIEIAEFATGVGDNRMFITQHRLTKSTGGEQENE